MADRAGPVPPTQGSVRRGLGAFLGLVRRWLVVGFLGCVLPAIRAVDSREVLADGGRDDQPGRTCYLAHEISSASYYAYVWGNEARVLFGLVADGHIIASNLHADTLEETRDQLCRENGVAHAHLDAVTLKVFLQVKRTVGWSMRRWVSCVYESDGRGDHLLWTKEGGGTFVRHQPLGSAVVSQEQEEEYAEFLAGLLRQGVRHIDDVRRALVKGERMEGWKNARLDSG